MFHVRPLNSSVLLAATILACSGDGPGAAGDGGAGSGGSSGGSSGSSGSQASDAAPPPSGVLAAGWQKAFAEAGVGLTCAMDEAQMKAAGAPSLTFGTSSLYVGFQQDGQNQDPVFARFDAGTKRYCEHHETEGPDGRALGVTWDGGATAYVVYTIVGGGSAFDAKAKGRWLDRYGDGGGSSRVSFVGEVDAESGALRHGTFVIAKKKDGKTNTHGPTDAVLRLEDGRIELHGSSAFQPMNPDRSIMQCTDYPFLTRYVFSADLTTLACSSSTNCTSAAPCP